MSNGFGYSEILHSESDWYHKNSPGEWHHDVVYTTVPMHYWDRQNPSSESRAKPENLLQELTSYGPWWDFQSHRGIIKTTPPYHRYRRGKHSWTTWYDPYGPTSKPSFPANSTGATEHLLKLRDVRTHVAGLTAEIHKTASGFAHAAHQVGKIVQRVRGIRRGRFNTHDVATTHLAVQYGIKPVVSDLHAAVTSLDQIIGKDYIHRVKSTHSEYKFLEHAGINWKVHYTNRRVSYVKVKANARDLDLGSPLEWAWELTPFSFVVDWFFPIGDYIAASFADRGLQYLGGTLTRKQSARYWSQEIPSGHAIYEQPKASFKSYQRAVVSGFEIPDKVRLDPSDSLTTLGNAVALLRAIRGR